MFTKKISLIWKVGIVLGFALLFLQISTYAATFNCDTQPTDDIATGDCKALLDFYDSTSGPGRQTGGWDSNTAVCSRSGVTCNIASPKRVTKLEFGYDTNMQYANLSGILPASLSGLTELTRFYIYITSSNLTGNLPPERSTRTKMNTFFLCRQNINGILPPERSTRTGIVNFSIVDNKLTGSLPASWSGWTKIYDFQVFQNTIGGILPPERSTWTGIYNFYVSNNQLTGTLPIERSTWTKIELFQITNNSINGTLPSERNTWTLLRYIYINNNQLMGFLPISRSGWKQIFSFQANQNNLTGILPPEWATRTGIYNFNVSYNKLRGTIPVSWSGWQYSTLDFNVSNNALKNTLPTELINSWSGTRNVNGNCMKTGYSAGDIVLLNNHGSSRSTQRQCNADIQMTKTLLTTGILYPGQTISYLLNYKNNGYEDALDIMLYDYTGTFLSLQSANIPHTSFATGRSFTGNDLMAGESGSIIVTGIISNSINTTGLINTAFVTSYNTGDTVSNNTSISTGIVDTSFNCNTRPTDNIATGDCQALIDFYNSTNGAVRQTGGRASNTAVCSRSGVTCNTDSPKRVTQIEFSSSKGLYNTNLSGTLPDSLSGLTEITGFVISISSSNLKGVLPSSLETWTRISKFQIYGQKIAGSLPSEWSTRTGIYHLDLAANLLTGILPPSRSSWTGINYFSVYSNQLTGTLPSERSTWTNVNIFMAKRNSINGILPSERSTWGNISNFQMDGTQITGSLPISWSGWSNLSYLGIVGCHINGTLPTEWSALENINSLYLDNNNITGTLPSSRSGLNKLIYINLSQNNLNGTIPNSRSLLTGLSSIDLSYNQLTGNLPIFWSGLTKLNFITLNNNNFNGTIPSERSVLTGMLDIYLNNNQLTGTLQSSRSGWTKIRRVSVNNNFIYGTLPDSWSSLTGIMQVNLSNNKLRGTIPASWSGWEYASLNFNVSNNALKSTMPTELINSWNGTWNINGNCMKTGYSAGDTTLLNSHGSSRSTQRQCNADIQITKTLLTTGSLYPGDTVSYLLNYQNNGYEDAIDVMIYDYTGTFLSLQSASIPHISLSTGWYFTGNDLIAGESGTIIITGIIASSVSTTGIINTGYVTSYNTGDVIGNNRSFVSATVLDIVAPVPSFANNVAASINTGDIISITGTDNIINSAVTVRRAYDADGICPSGSGSYPNSTTTRIENTETHNGQYICIYAQDASGNTGTLASSNTLNIDITPPATLPVCTTGQYFSGSIFVSCISAETGSFMRFLTGGIDPTSSSPIWSDTTLANTTNLKVTSCDALNNCNVTNTNQIYTLDNTAPTTIINDTNSNWRNTDISRNISGTDAGIGGVQTYYKVLDGNVVCSTGGFVSYTGGSTISGISGDLVQKTICFYSTDSLGNTENIKSQLYKIDMSNPIVAAPILYSGALYGNYFKGSVSLQSNLNDTGAGIKTGSCQVQTFLSSWSSRSLTTQIPSYCQYNNYMPNQSFSIVFLVNDAADNTGISNQSNYLFDNTAPSVGVPGIYSGLVYGSYYKGTINIQASVSDAGSALDTATCMYSLDNGSSRNTGVYNGGYCQDSDLTPNTTIDMVFRINDNLGTTWTSVSNTYIYDNTAPNTTDDSDTSRHNTDQTITLTANDTGAGIVYTQYCVTNSPATCDPETVGTSGTSVIIMASSGTIVQQRIFYYSVDNLNNKESVQQSNIIKIDKIGPTGTVEYDVSTPTSGNVIAALTGTSEPITVTNNSGFDTHTFSNNGSFVFQFQDVAGNTGSATATVTWIDTSLLLLSGGSVLAINNTAVYNFTSTKTGAVVYSGICGSGTLVTAVSGNNSTTFTPLINGLYSICQLRILDIVGNFSNTIDVPSFTISYNPIVRTNSLGSSSARVDNCCISNLGYGLPGSNKQCKDYSPSYYDNTCEGSTQEVHNTAGTTTGTTTIKTKGSIKNSPYSNELNQAYLFAFDNSMTNKATIQKADMRGKISKIALAKMLVNYSIRVLGNIPNTGMNCNFTDITNQTQEMKLYAKLACQLGIMGIKPDGKPSSTFSATAPVDRAMFGTTLSRMLWGNTYNKAGKNRYDGHLQALNIVGVMKDISKPLNKEIRGSVMLMLMRAAEELK